MYDDNEILTLVQNVGIEGKDGFIPKGSEVIFVKAVDDPNNISRSMVVVNFGDRQLALPELAVKSNSVDTIDVLKDFNRHLIDSNPDLKMYHHNKFMRAYYKVLLVLANIFINPIKRLYNHLTNSPKSVKVDKQEAVRKEIMGLMKEKE